MSDPIHLQLADDVARVIRGLNLDQIGEKVFVRQVGDDDDSTLHLEGQEKALPFVIVCPFGSESVRQKYNSADNIDFPCLVLFYGSKDETRAGLSRRLLWRQLTWAAMNERAYSTPAGQEWVARCEFEPILDPSAWFDMGIALGGLRVLACGMRIPRNREGN